MIGPEERFKSQAHLLRFLLGSLLVLVGLADAVVNHVIRGRAWATHDVYIELIMIGGGLGVMFTDKVIKMVKAALPWRTRRDDG